MSGSIFDERKAEVYLAFSGPYRLTSTDGYRLTSLGAVLQLRLTTRLREELGGTYGVVVQPGISWEDGPRYQLMVTFASAPERARELTEALVDVIRKLQAEGPTEHELNEIAWMQRRQVEAGRRLNQYWVNALAGNVGAGWPVDEGLASAEPYRAELTVENLRNAAREYLNLDNYVRITFLPKDAPAPQAKAD